MGALHVGYQVSIIHRKPRTYILRGCREHVIFCTVVFSETF